MMMDARKFRILQAIIDDYILTAIPVGSRTISKKYEMGLSSATIRNEMSDLEELGYLDQPHVSAGRIPSAKAYRLYVDQLLQRGMIAADDTDSVCQYFSNRTHQMEDVISHAAQVLSGLTHYTALVVIVTDGGIMRDTVVDVGKDMDADTLYAISRMLTEKLSGHTLSEAQNLLKEIQGGMQENRELLAGIMNFMDTAEGKGGKPRLALGGASNILNFPEYNDVEKAKNFLSILETKDQLVKLLEDHSEMAFTVRIGPETGIPELSDCSLVTATYRLGDNTHGTIGVIGPTRMQYGHVFSVLNAMGKQLSELLGKEKE